MRSAVMLIHQWGQASKLTDEDNAHQVRVIPRNIELVHGLSHYFCEPNPEFNPGDSRFFH